MILFITNNSSGSAIKSSRKILSKYFFQVSHNSYIGKISKSGFYKTRDELLKSVTNNMSVQFYKPFKKTYKLVYSIGNKENFYNNIYKYKSKDMINETYNYTYTKNEQLLKEITILAGLFHDLGKNTIKFQDKLISSNSGNKENNVDLIRHELVSYLILKQFEYNILIELRKIDRKLKLNNLEYFKYLSNKDNLIKFFSSLNKIELSLNDIKSNYNFNKNSFNNDYILLNSLNWLVLTHHKLSDNIEDFKVNSNMFDTITVDNLLNEYKDISENSLQENLTIKNNLEFLKENYIEMIVKSASNILEIITNEEINYESLFYYIPYLCRPILINSDYMASNYKEINLASENCVFANTKKGLMADPLSTHLIKCANLCEENFDLFKFNIHRNSDLKKFSLENSSSKLIDNLNINEDSFLGKDNNFRWQQDVVNKILSHGKNNPTFCVIISETGSGKTRAIPKILTALNQKEVRFNNLLGLKSLTKQTYDEYINIGFKNSDINCLIGGELSKKEFKGFAESGTFNDLSHDFDFDLIKESKISFNKYNDFYSVKEKNILSKPVTVATIDHFIKHGSLNNGSTTNLFLRSISSDLVLDEVDNYNYEQINMISKLVFLAGLYCKNVILSGATIDKELVKSLFFSYKLGLIEFSNFNNIKNFEFNELFVSNYLTPTNIKSNVINGYDIEYNYSCFFKKHISNVNNKNFNQNLDVLDISLCDNNNEVYKEIYTKCKNLHEINNCKHNDKKISIGFVKFNIVSDTINFARYLDYINDSENQIFIFCYHSKFTQNDIDKNEAVLSLLKRKNKELYQIEYFKDLINKSTAKNIIFIVSTSSIIQVGRDHDYDWAIIDPDSTDSLIQASGRVRRHRNESYKNINVSVLSKPVQSFNSSIAYRKTLINLKSTLNNEQKNDINILLNNLIASKQISNKYCIFDDYGNELKQKEIFTQNIYLNSSNLSEYFNQNIYLTNKNSVLLNAYQKTIFRNNKKKEIILINNEFYDQEDLLKITNIKYEPCKSLKFVINNFEFKENQSKIYNILSINNYDFKLNLKYSNIFGIEK